jgi:hypothetical protein
MYRGLGFNVGIDLLPLWFVAAAKVTPTGGRTLNLYFLHRRDPMKLSLFVQNSFFNSSIV